MSKENRPGKVSRATNMNYKETEKLIDTYSDIIGTPILNRMAFLDERKITSLLASKRKDIKAVFSAWWLNGHDNKKAISHKNASDLEVFAISYNPLLDPVIYYLRLSKYIQLREQPL
jgi:hypothetical protein